MKTNILLKISFTIFSELFTETNDFELFPFYHSIKCFNVAEKNS